MDNLDELESFFSIEWNKKICYYINRFKHNEILKKGWFRWREKKIKSNGLIGLFVKGSEQYQKILEHTEANS